MPLRSKYLICGIIVAVASTALLSIPPVQRELTEEGYIYYNTDWIPVTVFAGYAIVFSVVYLLWQTIRHYRSRVHTNPVLDDSSP
jgi:hypothetical protein